MEKLDETLTVQRATPKDAESIVDLKVRSWLDTYPNEAAGISKADLQFMTTDGYRKSSVENTIDVKTIHESSHPDDQKTSLSFLKLLLIIPVRSNFMKSMDLK